MTLDRFGIKKGKNIYNIDKLGACIRCLSGEEIIVSIEVKEMYTSPLENQKAITIIEVISVDRQLLLPLLIICLRKRIIDL